jgi:hypothetical protein
MKMKDKEPILLKNGKKFHLLVQFIYKLRNQSGDPNPERKLLKDCIIQSNSKMRMDILVDALGDMVSIIEIKNTYWDQIKHVKKNLYSHQRQIWKYIEEYLGNQVDVCPGIIYPKRPDQGLVFEIESYLGEYGIQLYWFEDETQDDEFHTVKSMIQAGTLSGRDLNLSKQKILELIRQLRNQSHQ